MSSQPPACPQNPKKPQSRDAFRGSTGILEGLHKANEIVYKIVCGFHVSREQGYTAFISLNEAQKHVSIAGEGRRLKANEINSKLKGTQIFSNVKTTLELGSPWNLLRRTQP